MPWPRTSSTTAMRPILTAPFPSGTTRPVPAGTPFQVASACTASVLSCSSTSIEGGTPCSSTNTVQRRLRQISRSFSDSARRTFTIGRAFEQGLVRDQVEDRGEAEEEEEGDEIARGEPPERFRHVDLAQELPRRLGELEHGEDGPRHRSAGDETRGEEDAWAALRLGVAQLLLGALVDEIADDAADHDRRRRRDGQIDAHRERQRGEPAQLEHHRDQDADEDQAPGQLL